MLETTALMSLLASSIACAQGSANSDSPPAGDEPASHVPIEALGRWTPRGRFYEQLGDLTISRETVTWSKSTCAQVPYRVLRTEGRASLVEVLRPASCRLNGEASFLIIEPSDQQLELSICWEKAQFGKPRAERLCTWGLLIKRDDENASVDAGGLEQLSAEVLGTWIPDSRSYEPFGNLVIERQTLSWAACKQVPYRVQRKEGSAALIELVQSPTCRLNLPANFMIFELSDGVLTTSICQDNNEFSKPPTERSCSWGLLRKQRH
jgi:hypothetical protein